MEISNTAFLKVARRHSVGLLRWILFESGFLRRLAHQSKRAVILVFHAIPEETAEEFHDLLRYLSHHFSIVPLEAIIDRAIKGASQRSTILALTFDDGLRNHRSIVYPVLADLRLPATFYVCPGLIGRAETTWTWEFWCRAQWLSETDRRELSALARITNSTDPVAVLQWMKTIPLKMRKEVEENIRIRTAGFVFTDAERKLYELMNWKELAELDPSLINIGSHTMTHCDLPVLSPTELAEEVQASRSALEGRLRRPVKDFCYPDGQYNKDAVQEVAKIYRSAVTSVCGSVTFGAKPHTLKRIGANMDFRWVSWLLATHTSPSHRCLGPLNCSLCSRTSPA